MNGYTMPLDGLNFSDEQMLELVNRMNKYFPDKYVLIRGYPKQMAAYNAAININAYQSQMANPFSMV